MITRLACLATLLIATSASAAPKTRDGFLLQFNLGPAYQSWTIDDLAPIVSKMTIEGTGAQLDVNIGGYVMPNLALFGQISRASAIGPTVTVESGSLSASDAANQDVAASTVGLGAGVQYAIESAGVYIAASYLSLQLQIELDGDAAGSETGNGFQFRVGKEWWVSDEWSLGVAAHYLGGSIPEENVNDNWDVSNFGVTFSASFN